MRVRLFLFFLLIVGFFYRVYGLTDNHSFWSDEEHVAIFARAILERGKPVLVNGYHTGVYQWGQYWLSAISARIFGLNEFAIRFPSVVFGVLTIWAVYLLGKELFNKNVGFVAAILITFSKIEILWSHQARPYQALQFFYVLSACFISRYMSTGADDTDRYNMRSAREIGNLLGFLGCGVLASLMHGLGLVILVAGLVYLLVGGRSASRRTGSASGRMGWGKLGVLGVLGALGSLGVLGALFQRNLINTFSRLGQINNLFYYRVFLWHNYSLLVFLALVGFLSLIFQKKKSWKILVLPLIIQGILVSFFAAQPFTRYFYIVFPFLILLAAAGLVEIAQCVSIVYRPDVASGHISPRFARHISGLLISTMLVLFIISMGHKFTLLPKKIYTLNEDMQEIPEVDWKKIYGFVEDKLKENPEVVLVTNWNDLPVWFLGEGKLDYLTRKLGKERLEEDPVSSATLLYSFSEFENIIRGNQKGIFIVDSWDDRVPDGVREYCRENFKKELEVDRLYPVQPRLWPVEVYSWGI